MNNTVLNELVSKAKKGDSKAIEELYQDTKNSIYFTCLKLVNDKEEALDLTQEVFISTFTNIKNLKDNSTFFAWQKMIAINKCKNYLMKNKPVLFKNEEDESHTVDIKDTDEEFIPESYIDNSAKRNIIMNIIDSKLSDVQRIVIMLFYYEEKKISQIAEILGCSEGTIKSRLNSAKKLIKEEVEEEERKGNKLYGVAPIPVLGLLLRESAKECKIPKEVTSGILEGIKSALKQGKEASFISKVGTTLKGMTVTKLIATSVIGVTVIGGGYVVASNIKSNPEAVTTLKEQDKFKSTLCGVKYTELQPAVDNLVVDTTKFSVEYNTKKIETVEIKDGVLHTTIAMDIEDINVVYSTLKTLKEELIILNEDKFKSEKVHGIEIILSGNKNSWLMDIDDKLTKIELKKGE